MVNILLVRRGDYAIFPDGAICLNTLPFLRGIRFFQHVLDNGVALVHDGPLSPCRVDQPDVGHISRKEMLAGLGEGRFDLVFEQPFYNERQGRWIRIARSILNALPKRFRVRAGNALSSWGEHLPMGLLARSRQVVIDGTDRQVLTPFEGEILLSGALYLKWDLPYDRSKLFFPKRKDSAMLDAVEARLRYYPLGISDVHYQRLRTYQTAEKRFDVFWAGKTGNTHRAEAVARLETIQRRGELKVLIPPARVSEEEFFGLAAQSRVMLSPEGQGWECWRHLQAFALGSVPFMNMPTADAHAYRDLPGELFYENNFRDFESGLKRLCGDGALRQSLLETGTEKIRSEFLWSRIMNRILFEVIPAHFPELAERLGSVRKQNQEFEE